MDVQAEVHNGNAAPGDESVAQATHVTAADANKQYPPRAQITKEVFGFADLLESEEVWIESRAETRRIKHLSQGSPREVPARQIGLAISGGGVRSATYGLGVLQAMAKPMEHGYSLLGQVGYTSSVSGGSYINSWLTAWMRRAGFDTVEAALAEAKLPASVAAAKKQAAEASASARTGDATTISAHADPTAHVARIQNIRYKEQRPVSHLREYSSYLTPESGWLSADVWTAVAGYLMRLMPNFLFVVCVGAAAVLAPYLLRNWVLLCVGHGTGAWVARIAPWFLSLIAVAWPVGHVELESPAQSRRAAGRGSVAMFASCLMGTPFVVWLGSRAAGFRMHEIQFRWEAAGHPLWTAWLLIVAICGVTIATSIGAFSIKVKPGAHSSRLYIFCAAATVGTATLVGVVWLMGRTFDSFGLGYGANLAATLMPMSIIAVYLAVSSMYLFLLRYEDETQEWLNRMWGGAASQTLLWALLAAMALLLPKVITLPAWRAFAIDNKWKVVVGALAWLGTTIASVMSAYSGKTGGPTPADTVAVPLRTRNKRLAGQRWFSSTAASAAPYLVVFGGLAALVLGGAWVFHRFVVPHFSLAVRTWAWEPAGLLLMFLIAWTLGWFMDVNRLSLHNFYRFRLAECYLDAVNGVPLRRLPKKTRDPNRPAKGAKAKVPWLPDENSLLPLWRMADRANDGPYPIINSALNVTKKGELSLQRRKALNFIFSPKFCGFHHEGGATEMLAEHAYRRTKDFLAQRDNLISINPAWSGDNKQVMLAEAMAISGAAASPNQGNHTSPAVAVLLAMFNIRLGAWVGNPRHSEGWEKMPTRHGWRLLMDELLARTNDEQEFVYLSDGGHFENLGLYELVRRQCRIIFCSDADCDQRYEFKDLLNAMERVYVDFNAKIEIDFTRIKPSGNSGYCRTPFAVGSITYTDGTTGALVVFKPAVTRNSWEVVADYDASNRYFPHEPTTNQWFDEEQFEAYRLIGMEAVHAFVDALGSDAAPAVCDEAAWKLLRRELQ
jgi:hypothetical protein